MKNEISHLDLEGKLIAHHTILKLLIRHIAQRQNNPEQFWQELIDETQVFRSAVMAW